MAIQLALSSVVFFLMFYGRIPILWLTAGVLAAAVAQGVGSSRRHTHGAFLSIDFYAQQSRLCGWHSGWKLALAIFCAAAVLSAQTPLVPICLFGAMGMLTVRRGGVPLKYYLSLLSVPALFILLSCLSILIQIGSEPGAVLSFQLGNWRLSVTSQSQQTASLALFRAFGATSCLYFLSLSTPISRLIGVLGRCRVPPAATELMALIYRYLFILLETHRQMTLASESRLGYQGFRRRISTMLKNAFGLLFLSFRRTSDLLTALESRCYDGELRFLPRPEQIGRSQLVVSAGLSAVILLILILERAI